MKNKCFNALAGAILAVTLGLGCSVQGAAQSDPLPAWNDTPSKQAIVDAASASVRSFITPMPNANMPTIGNRISAASTSLWWPLPLTSGP